MPSRHRLLLAGLLLAALPFLPSRAQPAPQSTNGVDGAWQADVEENQRLDREARAQAREDAPAALQHADGERRGPPPGHGRGGGGGGSGGDGSPEGGARGGGGPPRGGGGRHGGSHGHGGLGGPGGPGPGGDADAAPPARLLRPEFEFAAPLAHGLLIQRMRDTAIFASRDGSQQRLVPIGGEPVELEGGLRALAREVDGALELHLETPDGFQVDYRYLSDPATPDAMRVQVQARNRGDTEPYRVERVYRQGSPH